jgi:glycosyltransferase involved in cell wall biosynthesis
LANGERIDLLDFPSAKSAIAQFKEANEKISQLVKIGDFAGLMAFKIKKAAIKHEEKIIALNEFDTVIQRLEPMKKPFPPHGDADIDEVLKKHVITKPYILAVGKLEPRKNLHRLIAAFLRLYREDIDLVIVGQAGWDVSIQQLVSQASKEANVEVATRQLTIASNNIRFLGYIPDDELTALYRGATCFAFPSIWEGFGYPVVEAMQQEVPICCSNTSSIAEIAKDVAVFFDPGDVHDITRALHETLRLTPEARMKRTNAGFKRAEEFSWAKYYKTMIDALRI